MAAKEVPNRLARRQAEEDFWFAVRGLWNEVFRLKDSFKRRPGGGDQSPAAPPSGLIEVDQSGTLFLEPRLLPVLKVTEEELLELFRKNNPGEVRPDYGRVVPLLVVPRPGQEFLGFDRCFKFILIAVAGGTLLYWVIRGTRGFWGGEGEDDDDAGGPPPDPEGLARGGGGGLRDALAGVAGENPGGAGGGNNAAAVRPPLLLRRGVLLAATGTVLALDLAADVEEDVQNINVIPESVPDWIFGNVSPARMDFRWFCLGNFIASLSPLETGEQAVAILDLVEEHWQEITGEMPLKICYPAMENQEWQIVTGCDPKNTRWSYHNAGSPSVLLWLLVVVSMKLGRPHIARRAGAYGEGAAVQG